MVDIKLLQIASVPSCATGFVSTAGFASWIRFRKGHFPSIRIMTVQLALTSLGSLFIGYQDLRSAQRREDAMKRMLQLTEGKFTIDSRESSAVIIPDSEFDNATGSSAEAENLRLLGTIGNKKESGRS